MKILRLVVGAALVCTLSLNVFAQNEQIWPASTTVTVNDNNSATVEYRVALETATPPEVLNLNLVGRTTEEPTVTVNNTTVTAQTQPVELTQNQTTIIATRLSVPLTANLKPDRQEVRVSYTTNDVMIDFGNYQQFVWPSIAGNINNAVKVDLNLERSLPIIYSSAPADTAIDGSRQTYDFLISHDDPNSIVLGFGTNAATTVTSHYSLENKSWWWQVKTIALPSDTHRQQALLDSLSPRPDTVRVDPAGNIVAEYRLRPRQTIDITAQSRVMTQAVDYSTPASTTLAQLADQLAAAPMTESYLEQESGAELSVATVAEAINAALARYQQAGTSLQQLQADFRATGIPARTVSGYLLLNNAQATNQPHNWLELYTGSSGWVTFDPTTSQRSDQPLLVDPLRISLTTADATLPNNATFSTTQPFSAQPPEASVQATKFVLFPGLSLVKETVTITGPAIVDRVEILSAGSFAAGSLAPGQSFERTTLAGGSSSWQDSPVTVSGLDPTTGEIVELSTTTAQPSYFVLIAVTSAIAALVTVAAVYSRWFSGRPTSLGPRDEDINVDAEDLLRPISSANETDDNH